MVSNRAIQPTWRVPQKKKYLNIPPFGMQPRLKLWIELLHLIISLDWVHIDRVSGREQRKEKNAREKKRKKKFKHDLNAFLSHSRYMETYILFYAKHRILQAIQRQFVFLLFSKLKRKSRLQIFIWYSRQQLISGEMKRKKKKYRRTLKIN